MRRSYELLNLAVRYLEEVRKSQWAIYLDVEPNESQAPSDILKNIAQGVLPIFGKIAVDAGMLFEYTVLQELAHYKLVGDTQAFMGEKESYGWSECVTAKSSTNTGMAVLGDLCRYSELTQGRVSHVLCPGLPYDSLRLCHQWLWQN